MAAESTKCVSEAVAVGMCHRVMLQEEKMARIVSVNKSEARGVVKKPCGEGVLIRDYGLEGDAHADGSHRQLSLLGVESYKKMEALGMNNMSYGAFAENITTEGICLFELPIGTKLRIGECETVLTQIGKECHTGCEIRRITGDCVMPREGVFVRITRGGQIHEGDIIEICE